MASQRIRCRYYHLVPGWEAEMTALLTQLVGFEGEALDVGLMASSRCSAKLLVVEPESATLSCLSFRVTGGVDRSYHHCPRTITGHSRCQSS